MSVIRDLEAEAMAHLRDFVERGDREDQVRRFYAYVEALKDCALMNAFEARQRGKLDWAQKWSDMADQVHALLPPPVASDAQK